MKPITTFLLTASLAAASLALTIPIPGVSSILESRGIIEPRRRGKNPGTPKYFREPGGNDELGHYDERYFAGPVGYDEHLVNLRHLVRSYLTVFRALGVDTWLAHGTLLGWWWNGQIMPWDYDLDTQVTASSLVYLGEHYNRTMHEYRYLEPETGEERSKFYLLDVNPNIVDRTRGNGMNVIDARWIDTSSGMFIDITGLSERDPSRAPGVWACKNNHHYKTTQLYPMRETEFEGVPALVPYEFDTMLVEEYGKKSLVTTTWEGHKWNPSIKQWVKQKKGGGHVAG